MSTQYQVRFEWGANGLADPADILVVADADDGASGDVLRAADFGLVLSADIDDAPAVADQVLAEQERLGRRATVLILAAGGEWPDGSLRFDVGDHLVAGRVVDALADVGIDFHSPEAAIACAAAVALRPATAHLIRAATHS